MTITGTSTTDKAVDITTAEQAKELIGLCRAGNLYDVEKRLAAGKPLEIFWPIEGARKFAARPLENSSAGRLSYPHALTER